MKNTKPQKIISIIIFILIATFFLVETLMKPISGEDIAQQGCMADRGWAGIPECTGMAIDSVPRLGQVYHYLVIWQFHNMPTLGFETLIRIIDAVVLFAIIYLITVMATGGKRLRLNLPHALTFASVFILLLLSPFTEMVFKGFSNIHNYAPAVLFTLIFIYFWFWRNKIQNKLGKIKYNIILISLGFLFAGSTELNSIAFFGTLLIMSIWRILTGAKFKTIRTELKTQLPGIIGVVLGFALVFIIGQGGNSVITRSSDGYMGSVNLGELFINPLSIIPALFANLASHLRSYLPFILIAIAGVVIYYILFIRGKKPARISTDTKTQLNILITPIIFTVIYVALCSSVASVMQRLTVVPFCTLLIPVAYMLFSLYTTISSQKILHTLSILACLLLVSMTADNLHFLIKNLHATNKAISMVLESGCLDKTTKTTANLPESSKLFRFAHPETALTYTDHSWFPNYYRINETLVPIKTSCR